MVLGNKDERIGERDKEKIKAGEKAGKRHN
jgi:hypothetical protein